MWCLARATGTRCVRLTAVAGVLVLALLVGASAASASEGTTILERCIHGESLSGFSQNGYREALKNMPTEVSEYSECPNLIGKAELMAVGGGQLSGTGTSSNVAIPLTPSEQHEVLSAHHNGSGPLPVGTQTIRPGVVHATIASAVNTLPHSLFAVLAFVAASAIALAGWEVHKRVRARRHS